jgi:hypothetical protein
MSALICDRTKHDGVVHICPQCVHPFTSAQAFIDYFSHSSKHFYQKTIYAQSQLGKSIVKWKSREKTERVPSVIYADFESCLIPVHDNSGVLDEHIPSKFCAYTISANSEFETGPVTYSDRDCITVFYDHLANKQHRIACILKGSHEMLPLTRYKQERFDLMLTCATCNKQVPNVDVKVKHHNHRMGKFIAALCNGCNLYIKTREYYFLVPIVCHNLRKYDIHHMFRHLSKSIAAKYDKKKSVISR